MSSKIIIKILIILTFISSLSLTLSRKEAYAYRCPNGFYCETAGGVLGLGVWVNLGGNYCHHRTNYVVPYSCSGTDSNCNGGRDYWYTQADCLAGTNTYFAGCCNLGSSCDDCSPGSAPSCPAGTTGTDTGDYHSQTSTCCSNGDGCDDNCNTRNCYCATCTLPSCSPTYATTNQGYGSTTVSCLNGISTTPDRSTKCSTRTGTCYCYNCTLPNCPAPLTNTSIVASPNLVLENFRSCTNDCAVTTRGNCYEVPSSQPTESITVIKTNPPDDQPNRYDFDTSTHSGTPGSFVGNLNDPVKFTATYSDTNGASDIEAIFVWFRDDTSVGEPGTPIWISTTASPKAPGRNSWGFMMHRENGGWYPYIPSYPASGTATWTRVNAYNPSVGTFYIYGVETTPRPMVEVTVPNSWIYPSGLNDVKMDFTLRFSGTGILDNVSQIKYKILLMGLDRFSFTPNDNYSFSVDINANYWKPNQLRYRSTPTVAQIYARDWYFGGTTWTIDKGQPTIQFTNGTPVVSGNTIRIDWSATDDKDLYSIVGNIYTTEGADARTLTLSSSTTGILLNSSFIPTTESSINTGRLNGDWSFKIDPTTLSATTKAGSVLVNIGANRRGSLRFYLTVFDDAGNMLSTSRDFNLDDWFVTDGGLTYSQGGTNFVTKSVGTTWSNILPPFALTSNESLRNTMADYSSEMWGELNTTSQVPQSLLRSLVSKSFNLRDFPSTTLSSYYTTLMEAYIQKRSSIPLASLKEISIAGDVTVANANLTAIFTPMKTYNVALITGKLVVDRLNCNGNSLIFVNGDIDVLPNISNQFPDRNACIFVSSGNINIYEGVNNSNGGKFGYDQVNGFFFADGIITVRHETSKAPDSIIDGIYLNGGIEAMTNIKIERYLRLIERLSYPVLAIDAHPKYGVLGGIYFANNFIFQKVETGFKPL